MTVRTIGDLVEGHPELAAADALLRRKLPTAFPDFADAGWVEQRVLAPFVLSRPAKYFSRPVYLATYEILNDAIAAGINPPPELQAEVRSALAELRRASRTYREDLSRSGHLDERARFDLREYVFPNYARIAEYTYCGLLGLVLHLFLRLHAPQKSTPPKLRSRWEMAQSRLPGVLTTAFDATVRNAIVHGGVRFDLYATVFRDDKNREVQLDNEQCHDLYNDLLDTCSGMAAAFSAAHVASSPNWMTGLVQEQRLAGMMSLPLLEIEEVAVGANAADQNQAEALGIHRYWRLQDLALGVARAFAILRHDWPHVERLAVSLRGPDDMPAFFSLTPEQVPTIDSDIGQLGHLHEALAESGIAFLEPRNWLHDLLGRFQLGAIAGNWADGVDFSINGDLDYELRDLKDISVNRQSRFKAIVVSHPSSSYVDDNGCPTDQYLLSLFMETFLRWAIRDGESRQVGARRIRVFTLGEITVVRHDGRLHEVRSTGLKDQLLFRFEGGFRGIGIPFLGSKMERVGLFNVSVNPAGRDYMLGL